MTFTLYGLAFAAVVIRYRGQLLGVQEAPGVGRVALGASIALDVLGWELTARRVAEEVLNLYGAARATFPASIIFRRLAAG